MRRTWSDIEARNRETDALGERLELTIHAIALVLTAVVLAMRLVAGTQDLADAAAGSDDSGLDDRGPDVEHVGTL